VRSPVASIAKTGQDIRFTKADSERLGQSRETLQTVQEFSYSKMYTRRGSRCTNLEKKVTSYRLL
jgi:hypothetical protein